MVMNPKWPDWLLRLAAKGAESEARKKAERAAAARAAAPAPNPAAGDVVGRARLLLRKIGPAVSKAQGHSKTYWICRCLYRGYGAALPEADADGLLREWNATCQPPWSEAELAHKVREAKTKPFGKPDGWLLLRDRPRRADGEATCRTLRNYVWDEVRDGETMRRVKKGLAIPDIADDLLNATGGWPKAAGGKLFVVGRDGRPEYLKQPHELFGWAGSELAAAGGAAPVEWAGGPDLVPKCEFHAGLGRHVESYDAVQLYPHEPPLPGHYYHHPEVVPGDGTAVLLLLDFFNPATPEDRRLLLAFLLTLAWGGGCGQRPAFVFTAAAGAKAAGRGAGKSTVAERLAGVFGGVIALGQNDDFAKFTTRLLSAGSAGKRVVMVDNLKSNKFSHADLEAFVTRREIGGHDLYVGEGTVPNVYTVAVTVNGASLSKDLGQRAIPVHLDSAAYTTTWLTEVDAFIEAHRWAIIGDLIAILRSDPRPMTKVGRWGSWQGSVLARLPDPDGLFDLIAGRQDAIDADGDEAELVRAAILAAVRGRFAGCGRGKEESYKVRISSKLMASIVRDATDEHRPVSRCTAYLKTLDVKGLRYVRLAGFRGWEWTGDKVETDSPTKDLDVIPQDTPQDTDVVPP